MRHAHHVALCACAANLATGAAARPLPFVASRAGKAAASIVVAKQATPAAAFAAAELREHLRKITGAEFPLVTDDKPVQGRRILVGESAATRKLGIRSAAFGEQEYLVLVQPQTIVLIGRDTSAAKARAARAWLPPGRAQGRFGRALAFDGKRTAAAVPDSPFPDEAGTIEAWVFLPKAMPRTDGTILRLDSGSPWTYHILQRPAGTRTLEYRLYDGKTVTTVRSAELPPGWHHLAATHDRAAGRAELFVDGKSVGTTGFAGSACGGAMLGIGGMPPYALGQAGVGNPFEGLIDEVRISRGVRPSPGPSTRPPSRDASTLLLLHCDEPDGAPADAAQRTAEPEMPGFFDENGTLYAVYDFLERRCGVRWYLPGEIGTVAPRTPDLILRPISLQRKPDMAYRWITPTTLFVPTEKDRVSQRDNDLWRLRMRLGGQNYNATHSFYGYYDRFLKTHPDRFAKGYEGQPPQMCYTNEGFIAQVVQDAREYFDGKGTKNGAAAQGDFFALVPMDNMSWCKCPACQALLNPNEKDNPQFSNGKASDYIWGFVNRVAREVRKTHPNKWIAALAYSDYAYLPNREPLEPNVAVQTCLHVRNWWCLSMERNDRRILREFTQDPRRPAYLWLYYCFPALQAQSDGYRTFPGFFAHRVIEQAALYHQAGIRGLFIEHSSEFGQSMLGDLPDLYLTLRLADDGKLDGQAAYEEFFRLFYGAAASPMRRLYEAIETTYSSPSSYPDAIRLSPAHNHQTRDLAWGSLGTPERMTNMAAIMAEAKAAAKTGIERKRVEMFEKGVWLPMVEGAAAYRRR